MSKIIYKLPHASRFASFISHTRSTAAMFKKEYLFLPSASDLRRFRSGSTISRFVRHIFEHKHINKILGSNIALAVIATSILQVPTTALDSNVQIEPQIVVKANVLAFATEKGVQFPVDPVKVNQRYHIFHPGIDLDGTTGDPVKPIMAGKVEFVQYSRFAYGNAVIVNHGNGLTSLYAHLSKISAKAEDEVTIHSVIGQMGSTGRSSGDHLHLEVRDNGRAINPLSILPR